MNLFALRADIIFDGLGNAFKDYQLIVNDEGVVQNLESAEKTNQHSNIEIKKFSGFICPGFINAHCHLELSYLKGQIKRKTGLNGFIKEIQSKRKDNTDNMIAAIQSAIVECQRNGIVAIGDICNDNYASKIKLESSLYFYNFIESFSIDPSMAHEAFDRALFVYDKYHDDFPGKTAIVPHAPYSVSAELFQLISDFAMSTGSLLSMHNQESASENEMFASGTGKLIDALRSFNIDMSSFNQSGKHSLPSVISKIPQENKLMLVHNTFSDHDDLLIAESRDADVAWCFCPKANLFIENALPDFDMFQKCEDLKLIGTDSLASNDSLNILEEIKIISQNSNITLQELIQWASGNAASFFNWNELGSFEFGKKPGINLIENVDLTKIELRADSSVKKLL